MEYLVSCREMREYEAYSIEELGIPSLVLMERAAAGLVEELLSCVEAEALAGRGVLILAGVGNNGADGLAAARMLGEKHIPVDVVIWGDQERATDEWKLQRGLLESFGVSVCRKPGEKDYAARLDALFGTGLTRDVSEEAALMLDACMGGGGLKMAADIPSGIHSDTGGVWGHAASVDVTVTFGLVKKGLALYPGKAYAGRVVRKDIGLVIPRGKAPSAYTLARGERGILPARIPWGNKGSFGKVVLAAGCEAMPGAAVLAARAAYGAGAGMVKVVGPEQNRGLICGAVPECLYEERGGLQEACCWGDVIGIGPGLGTGPEAVKMLRFVIGQSRLPLVLDADALNLVAEDEELWDQIGRQTQAGRRVIMTPHPGELCRLLHESMETYRRGQEQLVREAAEVFGAVMVGKDGATLVAAPGEPVYINTPGNSGMATAGSGDVLTGLIAGLLAQGETAVEAAVKGVFWHSLSGDAAAQEKGQASMMAGDIIKAMGRICKQQEDERGRWI